MACEQLNARPRLESLDAIRGFDMLWIVGLGGVCCSIGAGRAGRKAHRKPVEGTPVGGTGEVVRFDSAGSAHLIATCFASSPYRARVIFEVGAFIRRRHVVRQRAARHLRGPCRSPRNGVRVCVAARGEGAVKFNRETPLRPLRQFCYTTHRAPRWAANHP